MRHQRRRRLRLHDCTVTIILKLITGIHTSQTLIGNVRYSTKLIAVHQLSNKKSNYTYSHYEAIARKSHAFKEEHIADKAKENLEMIGTVYSYEQ